MYLCVPVEVVGVDIVGERQDTERYRKRKILYLSGDVRILLPVAVAVVGVDVVGAGDPVHRLQDHPTVIVRYHVRVPAVHICLQMENDPELPGLLIVIPTTVPRTCSLNLGSIVLKSSSI